MDKHSTVQKHTAHRPHPSRRGVEAIEVSALRHIWFNSVQELYTSLIHGMHTARISHWSGAHMAQDRSGDIYLYERRPMVVNAGNPCLHKWKTADGGIESDEHVWIDISPLPHGLLASEWQDSLVKDVAGFVNELVRWLNGTNREAENFLNQYRQRHPYAAAMTRLSRRRA